MERASVEADDVAVFSDRWRSAGGARGCCGLCSVHTARFVVMVSAVVCALFSVQGAGIGVRMCVVVGC